MKTVIYLLQVSACTGIFYGFYFLLLRRLTFFTVNRWYLLATLFLSFAIPALTLNLSKVEGSSIMRPVVYIHEMQTVNEPIIASETAASVKQSNFNWILTLQMVYLLIAFASIIHLLFTLVVFFLKLNNKTLVRIGKVRVLKGSKRLGNSSFLNVIFINDDELEPEEVQQIIAHEMLHIKLMHSADRLIARVIQILLWFNPFAYFYIRSIEENHEFEVDRIAAGNDNKGLYASLLFKLAVSGKSYLFHGFSKVPLKKRISMLFNKPTSNMKKIIYLLTLPVVVLSCLAFAKLEQHKKLSVLGDLSNLGPHPLVLINDKVYDDEILYKISGSCISSTGIYPGGGKLKKFKKYGDKAKDGVVKISTNNNPITYLTAIGHENLEKEAAVPNSQFFAHLTLKNEDGTIYEKGIIHNPVGGGMSNEFKPGEKLAFVVNGKVFTEREVNKVEQLIKDTKPAVHGTGPAQDYKGKTDKSLDDYNIVFYFDTDTTRYMQKLKQTNDQKVAEEKSKREFEAFKKTDEYKQKMASMMRVSNKTLPFKIIAFVNNQPGIQKKGFKIVNDNEEFLLGTGYGQEKELKQLLKVGDVVDIKIFGGAFGKGQLITVSPAIVSKNGEKIFQLAEADKIPDYAFLYEANKVRFTDGQVTSIEKYPNGKWKSAVVEVVNGYKIRFNIKPSAPEFKNIEWGDHVRFRFVHEVKTGAKEYTVNDWVSISNDIRSYGIKNPDYFFKFYEAV
ncbi:M56 family metallopeptidase [Mucilaginibacter segetis]|uniref:Peptidase M56 domain-containing protein n=1 Tax=Mucilaginibacter segetis TaxID=2793071 RepID=A0A934PTT7_9SPHI|nr:M56 family metallopeptidase [Mucilaginibacter segetis]MBK0379437.1 hypothetical protein [Mucilaginibacter segetis]